MQSNLRVSIGLADLLFILFEDSLAIYLLSGSYETLSMRDRLATLIHLRPNGSKLEGAVRGRTYICTRPLFIRQHNPFNDLDTRQTASLACCLQFFQNHRVHLVTLGKIFDAVAFDAVRRR